MAATEKTLFFLCKTGDVVEGEVSRVDVPGLGAIAVFNIDGAWYATDDTCTHGDASLSTGEVDGDIVECPYHQGAFNIRTGLPVAAPCSIPLKTYQVLVQQDDVFLKTQATESENA